MPGTVPSPAPPPPPSIGRPVHLDAAEVDALRTAAAYAATWVDLRRRTLQVPGVQVAVAVRGEVLLEHASGWARLPGTDGDEDAGEQLRTDHLFRIASHSKTFTATALMVLARREALRLDDTVGQHVPELAGSAVGDRTLAELLAHGGGVVRDTHDSSFWVLDRPFPDRDALVAAAHDHADVLPANVQFKYSNIGYGLLGLVIEAVSGRSYRQFLTEHVLEPLGLHDTGPELDRSRLAQYATGYSSRVHTERRVPIDTVDTAALASATGFWSTARDLTRYAASHALGGDGPLDDAARRRLHRVQWDVPGGSERYGLGFGVTKVGERTLVGHGGGFPGHITRTVLDPRDGVTVVVLTNAIDGPAEELAVGVVKLLDHALAAHRGGAGEERRDLTGLTGRFSTLWGVADLVDLGGRLHRLAPNQADPTAGAATLEVLDDDTARIADGNGYGSPGELVHWERGEDGAVAAVRIAGGRHVRFEEQVRALEATDRVRAPSS